MMDTRMVITGVAASLLSGLFFSSPVGVAAWTSVGAFVIAPAVYLELAAKEE